MVRRECTVSTSRTKAGNKLQTRYEEFVCHVVAAGVVVWADRQRRTDKERAIIQLQLAVNENHKSERTVGTITRKNSENIEKLFIRLIPMPNISSILL